MNNDVNPVGQWRDAWVEDQMEQHRAAAVGQDLPAGPGRKVELKVRQVAVLRQTVANVARVAALLSELGDHEQVLRFAAGCNLAVQEVIDIAAPKGAG